MAIKRADLTTLLEKAQGRWLAYDEEEKKRRSREQALLKDVDTGLDEGRSWEDISKRTGLSLDRVREHSQQTRPDYGIKPSNFQRLQRGLKDIGYKVADSVRDYAVDLGSDIQQNVTDTVGSVVSGERKGPGAEEILRRQDLAQKLPKDIQEDAKSLLSQDNLTLLDMVSKNKSQDDIRKFVGEASKRKAAADKKTLGTAAEVASVGLNAPGLAQAAKGGTKAVAGALLETAAGGAVGAAGSEARTNPSASARDIAEQAALGAGTGVAVSGATAGLGKVYRSLKKAPPVNKAPVAQIADEVTVIDDAIQEATISGDIKRARALVNDKTFLESQAVQDAKSEQTTFVLERPVKSTFSGTGEEQVSRLAKGTEEKAISEGLTEGFESLPGYQKMSLNEQASQVVDLMNTDYDLAKRIAMGETPPPQGIAPGSVYKGVEARAVREGDAELLERLATDSTIPKQASLQGQEIASLAYRDPESPVSAFREITEARKVSNLDIPPTITKEESVRIVELAQDVASKKNAITSGADRMEYGRARVAYDDYVAELVAAANKKSLTDALRHPVETAVEAAGVSKALKASLDNSSLLRQGWKPLLTHPGTWAKNAPKTFIDFYKAAGGKKAIEEVRADLISRPNALNGMYKKMDVDVFGIAEEAFPTELPQRIPAIGRLFKGSEAAYTGFMQRTRADLADKYLEIAQQSGVDLTSKKELKSIGKLVNSLTGRGDLGRTGERAAKVLNNVFFSPRLLKSNFDVLTGHQLQKGVTPFVRKRAAMNLVKIAVGSAAALKLASEVTGGKVEWDPRSSNFGKFKISDTRFDLTGGMSSIATLGSRIMTASTKSSTTGEIKKLNTGEYGSSDLWDTVLNFFENKTSPAASAILDVLQGRDFEGNKPTVESTIKNLTLPLIISNAQELSSNPRAAAAIPSLIAEGLGVSVNTYGLESNWNANNSKQVQAFKQKVDNKTFEKANQEFNQEFNNWFEKVSSSKDYWKLPQEKREGLLTSKKNALTEDVTERYGFKYKKPRRDHSTRRLIRELEKVGPY